MTRAVLTATLALLVACSDDDGGSGGTPDRLYLALLDSELSVQLVDQEPEPF